MSTPILVTKQYQPPPRPTVVPRPRLIARLNAGLHRKLTLIAAPAGFGKNHAGQRLGRRVRSTGCLAVAGRRGERPRTFSHLPRGGLAHDCADSWSRRAGCPASSWTTAHRTAADGA